MDLFLGVTGPKNRLNTWILMGTAPWERAKPQLTKARKSAKWLSGAPYPNIINGVFCPVLAGSEACLCVQSVERTASKNFNRLSVMQKAIEAIMISLYHISPGHTSLQQWAIKRLPTSRYFPPRCVREFVGLGFGNAGSTMTHITKTEASYAWIYPESCCTYHSCWFWPIFFLRRILNHPSSRRIHQA